MILIDEYGLSSFFSSNSPDKLRIFCSFRTCIYSDCIKDEALVPPLNKYLSKSSNKSSESLSTNCCASKYSMPIPTLLKRA